MSVMLGLGTVASVATVVGGIIAIATAAYHAGRFRNEVRSSHDDLANAHITLHQDIEEIRQEIDGTSISHRHNCPICTREEGD